MVNCYKVPDCDGRVLAQRPLEHSLRHQRDDQPCFIDRHAISLVPSTPQRPSPSTACGGNAGRIVLVDGSGGWRRVAAAVCPRRPALTVSCRPFLQVTENQGDLEERIATDIANLNRRCKELQVPSAHPRGWRTPAFQPFPN